MTAPGSRPPGTKIRGSRRPAKMKMSKNTEPSKRVLRSEGQVRVSNADVRKLEPEPQKPSKWISFGPAYGDADTGFSKMVKQSALQHIASKGGSQMEYLSSMSSREDEARKSYDRKVVDRLDGVPGRFLEMMVVDGCLFLQLALHILGAGELLGYPPTNPYFGAQSDSSSSCIPAMFFVWNQIPYVVINALMEQDFFRKVIEKGMVKGTWKRLRDKVEEDLVKLALYQVVVEPQLSRDYRCRCRFHCRCRKKGDRGPPPDILRALHDLLSGSRDRDPISPEIRAFQESQDLEAGMDDSKTKIPSAGELEILGITLKKAERGIINTRFKDCVFNAQLYVPLLTIDANTKDLFTNLVRFEKLGSQHDREVTAYIRFMKDLSPTYNDFKILRQKGIIRVRDENLIMPVLLVLDKIPQGSSTSNFTLNLRDIKRKIEGYKGPPWALIGIIISLFTIIQTILAAVAYAIPRT